MKDIVAQQESQFPDVHIRLHLPITALLVHGWREWLLVMFRNIIENACAHSRIPNQNLVIDIVVETRDEDMQVNIDDNGMEIPVVEREKVLTHYSKLGHKLIRNVYRWEILKQCLR